MSADERPHPEQPASGEQQAGGAADAVLAGVGAVYARVEALLAERRPRCEMSGRCCDFENSDHQLWASDIEVEYAKSAAGGVVPDAPAGLCPWWRSGLCTLREGRPLGCRLYFCDPSWTHEMEGVYERFHAELQDVHKAEGRLYSYRLFVDAVRETGPAEEPAP